jgi:hypothetical protein
MELLHPAENFYTCLLLLTLVNSYIQVNTKMAGYKGLFALAKLVGKNIRGIIQ